jgi:hypothetical protein
MQFTKNAVLFLLQAKFDSGIRGQEILDEFREPISFNRSCIPPTFCSYYFTSVLTPVVIATFFLHSYLDPLA